MANTLAAFMAEERRAEYEDDEDDEDEESFDDAEIDYGAQEYA